MSGIARAPWPTLALALLLAAPGAGAQAIYQWKDEKGVTHFSEHPPPDDRAKASKVAPKVTPPGNPGAYNPEAWRARDAEAKQRQVERGKGEQVEARDRARREAACNRARGRLSMLQNTQIIYKDNSDGTRTFMDDKQRDAEMGRAREAIREYCN